MKNRENHLKKHFSVEVDRDYLTIKDKSNIYQGSFLKRLTKRTLNKFFSIFNSEALFFACLFVMPLPVAFALLQINLLDFQNVTHTFIAFVSSIIVCCAGLFAVEAVREKILDLIKTQSFSLNHLNKVKTLKNYQEILNNHIQKLSTEELKELFEKIEQFNLIEQKTKEFNEMNSLINDKNIFKREVEETRKTLERKRQTLHHYFNDFQDKVLLDGMDERILSVISSINNDVQEEPSYDYVTVELEQSLVK